MSRLALAVGFLVLPADVVLGLVSLGKVVAAVAALRLGTSRRKAFETRFVGRNIPRPPRMSSGPVR